MESSSGVHLTGILAVGMLGLMAVLVVSCIVCCHVRQGRHSQLVCWLFILLLLRGTKLLCVCCEGGRRVVGEKSKG